ncbi:MAG: hypothetical protein AAF251_10045 [Pseudomonadota bacterium]
MFGFNKNKRLIEGPVEFTAEVEIDRPTSEIFPLLDIADPRFKHAQTGARVTPVEGSGNDYELTTDELEDVVFRFTVLERVEGSLLKIEAVIEPQINALEKSVETYIVEPICDKSCRVTMATSATFDATLSDDEIANEVAVMNIAVMGDMEKLKVLAEQGLEALQKMEEAELGFDIEFDLGELDIDWDDIEPEQ